MDQIYHNMPEPSPGADSADKDALYNAYSRGWCDGYKAKHVEFDWIDEGFQAYMKEKADDD